MKVFMRRGVLLSLVLLLAVGVASALADQPSPANPAGRILGVVPAHGQANRFGGSGGNLSYHNGPTMHANTVYAIYWQPSGYSFDSQGTYQSLLNGFFTNVAADNGKTSNVYYSDTQYYDNASGNISYSSSVGGSYLDTSAFPASGCSDSATPGVCLTDAQIQAEVKKDITAKGWSAGPSHVFFMFTPLNVGSCYSGSQCAFTYYCAYHSWTGSGGSVVLYANMPDAGTSLGGCGSGQYPNGNAAADSEINIVSHEHNESITDEQGSAWYDRRGNEDGDKCAWNFGTALGSTTSGQYNQLIGTGKYYLQREWSNHSSGCVLTGT
jgi:hypothetical protein